VTGESDPLHSPVFDINGDRTGALGDIKDQRHFSRSAEVGYLFSRLYRTEHVGGVGQDHQFCVRLDRGGYLIRVNEPFSLKGTRSK